MTSATSSSFPSLSPIKAGVRSGRRWSLSSASYNAGRIDLFLMAVTSQLKSAAGFGEVIAGEWRKAGLLKASVVKPVLATVERRLVLRRLGRLEQADRSALRQALQIIVG